MTTNATGLTPESDDLIAFLAKEKAFCHDRGQNIRAKKFGEAADRIAALEAEVKRLDAGWHEANVMSLEKGLRITALEAELAAAHTVLRALRDNEVIRAVCPSPLWAKMVEAITLSPTPVDDIAGADPVVKVADPVAEAARGPSSDYIAGYARAADDVDVMRASDGLLTGQKLIVSGLRIALTKLRAITEASHE